MTKVKKIKAKLGILFMLAAIMTLTTTYASAYTAGTSLTVLDGSDTTPVVGPARHVKFYVKILQNDGAYEAKLQDPIRWYTRQSEYNMKIGRIVSFERTEGSSGAYWKGLIKNGYISLNVTKR